MDDRYRMPTHPLADPRAVLSGPRYRITVLTDGLLRLEHADDGIFEDRASAFALHRDLPLPRFEVVETEQRVEVVTDRLHLVYDRGPFTASGLSVAVRGGVTSWHSVWRHGLDAGPGRLGGTARTLDEADGAVPLEPSVVSRDGYAVLDDSASPVLDAEGWVAPRDGSRRDLYVFAHGLDHRAALRDLYAVSGRQPVLPRWALGNWWSRYHRYTEGEYTALLDHFAAEGLPFSVAVLDMDWHVTDVDPRFGSGWTGYTWNRDLFPDPPAFLRGLHERGLRVTLNDHPADGVRAFEDSYPAMARAVGVDPASERPIAFDATDPVFLRAWFDVVHRPLEDDGVDFWWLDWQQGEHSAVPGIDPLWVLNHFSFLDSAREGRRPMTFSRYAGPGSHRYPVGFSGDTVATWASLHFQAEFTASAANIGYGWWSHDIGGHLGGAKDDDLAARWVQQGVLSPICRLHSSDDPFNGKEPSNYGAPARAAMTAALRLRHRLVPYLHTMNHRASHDGVPLVTPMHHDHPQAPQAYAARTQYAFGSQLVVAPITTPLDPTLVMGSVTAWLPEGTWVDVLSGLVYDGGREVVMHRPLDAVPVLASAGAVLPLDAAPVPGNDPVNPVALEVVVVVGADGALTLVEDDGTGSGQDPQRWASTPITFDQASGVLAVGPVTGATRCVPARRSWVLTFIAHAGGGDAEVLVDGVPAAGEVLSAGRRTTVRVDDVPVAAAVRVHLGPAPALAPNDVDERLFALLHRAQIAYATKTRVHAVATSGAPLATRLAQLQALDLGRPLETAVFELLLARPV